MERATQSTQRDSASVLLIDAHRLAELLGLSVRTIRRLDSTAKLPAPVRVGGAVRWRLSEVQAWLNAGCPDRITWERGAQGRLRRQQACG